MIVLTDSRSRVLRQVYRGDALTLLAGLFHDKHLAGQALNHLEMQGLPLTIKDTAAVMDTFPNVPADTRYYLERRGIPQHG